MSILWEEEWQRWFNSFEIVSSNADPSFMLATSAAAAAAIDIYIFKAKLSCSILKKAYWAITNFAIFSIGHFTCLRLSFWYECCLLALLYLKNWIPFIKWHHYNLPHPLEKASYCGAAIWLSCRLGVLRTAVRIRSIPSSSNLQRLFIFFLQKRITLAVKSHWLRKMSHYEVPRFIAKTRDLIKQTFQ